MNGGYGLCSVGWEIGIVSVGRGKRIVFCGLGDRDCVPWANG